MGASEQEPYAYCDALLRREDPDRWLAALFLPAERRPHVHALYAFNLEIGRVRRSVSEPFLGEIRFQWWREVLIGERAGEAAANPVAAALTSTLERCELPNASLLALIDARLFDLYDAPMPTTEALEAYARATAGQLFQLVAAILDPKSGTEPGEAATHAGAAYAMTGLMRALPWHAATGQVYLPGDMLERHDAVFEAVQTGIGSPALRAVLAELRGHARGHLEKFAACLEAKAAPAAGAFLPVSLCESYLRCMEKAGYEPFHTMIRLPQWQRQWRLWRAARVLK
ncbi:MAG: squalene/phytoene synthase family protein [Beijerinckiaceae bacterium]|nr:MAG: squalene/phytoene synthase family protein [Beijerinckiaceae bacterium]